MTAHFSSNTAEWPPQRHVFAVSGIDLVVDEAPHPFHLAEEQQAGENWERELAANPTFFNGRMVLQRDIRISDGAIVGRAHIIPFSTFLWWRKSRAEGAFHLYGLPVIVSGDGAVIAIRMGAHTANPGRVYCAAGSLDDGDVVDGRCDLEGNMFREVREETGLDLSQAAADAGFFAVQANRVVSLFRLYHFAETADELVARIRTHMETDPHPEIDDAVVIRSADPTLHNYSELMPPILDWFFKNRE